MTTILVVDQALEFGGSVVSTANLIRSVDPKEFRFIFVSAASESLIERKLREAVSRVEVRIFRKRIHYNNVRHVKRWLGSMPKPIRVLIAGALYGLRLAANSAYMARIAAVLLRHRVDIVQLNNGIDDEVAWVSRLFGVTQVVYLRGYTRMSALQRRFFLPRIRTFFAVSDYIRDEAIRDGIESDRVFVATPPAIPDEVCGREVEAIRRKWNVRADETAVGIFGRIIEWKGQREFLEAAAIVCQHAQNVRFFVIGDATDGGQEYLRDIQALAETRGIGSRVVFTGYVDNVYDYYEMLDIVVHASIEPEPSGRVVFEAMSQGKALIASVLGGSKEFVVDGVDGLLVDPRDTPELAQRILHLLEQPWRAEALGAAARQKIQAAYSSEAYGRLMEGHYRQALNQI